MMTQSEYEAIRPGDLLVFTRNPPENSFSLAGEVLRVVRWLHSTRFQAEEAFPEHACGSEHRWVLNCPYTRDYVMANMAIVTKRRPV